MKTMKIILLGVLFFVISTGTLGEESFEGAAFPQYDTSSTPQNSLNSEFSEDNSSEPIDPEIVEVELLRMISPSGNEVVFSLSKEVMGRRLETTDFEIQGVQQETHSALCQKTLSAKKELERAELKLELELMIEELKSQRMPRFLTKTQRLTLHKVPHCQMFKLPLTAISKMMSGYDYSEIASITTR